MIPVKQQISLGIDDLPVRASYVDDSIKSLEGGQNITFRCFNRNTPTFTCGRITLGPGSNGGGARLVCRQRFPNCCPPSVCRASRA